MKNLGGAETLIEEYKKRLIDDLVSARRRPSESVSDETLSRKSALSQIYNKIRERQLDLTPEYKKMIAEADEGAWGRVDTAQTGQAERL